MVLFLQDIPSVISHFEREREVVIRRPGWEMVIGANVRQADAGGSNAVPEVSQIDVNDQRQPDGVVVVSTPQRGARADREVSPDGTISAIGRSNASLTTKMFIGLTMR